MCGEWGEGKCQKVNLHEHTQCTEINSQRSGGCLEGTAALIQSKTSSSMAFQHHNVVDTKKKKRGGGLYFYICHLKQQKAKFTAVQTVTTCQNIILSHIRKIAYHDFY